MADTDTARAIELLRHDMRERLRVIANEGRCFLDARGHGRLNDLVEVAAAAVRLQTAVNDPRRITDMTADERVQSIGDRKAAWDNLDTAIANLTRGVLNNG